MNNELDPVFIFSFLLLFFFKKKLTQIYVFKNPFYHCIFESELNEAKNWAVSIFITNGCENTKKKIVQRCVIRKKMFEKTFRCHIFICNIAAKGGTPSSFIGLHCRWLSSSDSSSNSPSRSAGRGETTEGGSATAAARGLVAPGRGAKRAKATIDTTF